MAADIPYFTLNNGSKIPSIGLGCWMGEPGGGERVYQMCMNALNCGYRHLDTALGYENEEYVGRAIRDSGIPREEIFLTTKLPNHCHHKVAKALDQSLKALDCGYIDLYLIHWPQAIAEGGGWMDAPLRPHEHPTVVDTWGDMEKLLDTGKVKSIGVSNFSIKTLTPLLAHAKVVPVTNQVELHPCLPSHELKAFCESKGILLTAYSPIGGPQVGHAPPVLFTHESILSAAQMHNATPAQVLISWAVLRGTIVIPKSENPERLKANITLVKLSGEEMAAINNLHKQPGMHRSLLALNHSLEPGKVFGWTYDELGWEGMREGGLIA